MDLTMSTQGCTFDEEIGESVQFDRLCELCTKLFDSEAAWDMKYNTSDSRYRSHHNIRALEESADAGCHLCNLILGQIDSTDLEKMRKDLDEALVPSYRQIEIRVIFDGLEVIAWEPSISSQSDDLGDVDQTSSVGQHSWSVIAGLDMKQEEHDYTILTKSVLLHT